MAPCDLVPVSFKKSFAGKLDVEITKRHMMKKQNDMASSFQSKRKTNICRLILEKFFHQLIKRLSFQQGDANKAYCRVIQALKRPCFNFANRPSSLFLKKNYKSKLSILKTRLT